MKSFLCKGKQPIIRWSLLPDNTFFEGKVPEGFSLAVMPSKGYVVIDVDRHGKIDGFENIPLDLYEELQSTLNYPTKNDGRHYWFKYTGNAYLGNKASGQGIDLRVGCKGYVIWYPEDCDVRDVIHNVQESSEKMNKWLENLFSYVNKKKKVKKPRKNGRKENL